MYTVVLYAEDRQMREDTHTSTADRDTVKERVKDRQAWDRLTDRQTGCTALPVEGRISRKRISFLSSLRPTFSLH